MNQHIYVMTNKDLELSLQVIQAESSQAILQENDNNFIRE